MSTKGLDAFLFFLYMGRFRQSFDVWSKALKARSHSLGGTVC